MTTATLDTTTGTVRRAVVHIDDLDIVGIMHNARYALILERAMSEFWAEHGYGFRDGAPSSPDMIAAVREFTITYHAPVRGTGPILVHFWLDSMGETSAVYGFRFLSEDGGTVFADGRRVMVKMDRTGRPAPWTPQGREIASSLLR
ncbi:thioesterase family protein [Catellatospora sp. NPDC049111]|uniref:acyl-CoA thioesterase n=1 Tax=Catellatospora sp. NPDC049111 TaxID=3155271 RepID=UPI0033CB9549